jgi:entericidin B
MSLALATSRMAEVIDTFNRSEVTMFTKLIYCFAALATVLALSACNTIQGAGRDVEEVGQKVQDAAADTKRKM